jgi:ketol-acid reductoisomerase
MKSKTVYKDEIEPNFSEGKVLAFAHGFTTFILGKLNPAFLTWIG